ncbi:MAG: phosphoribosyltransferase family protein [Victivallaceae bacterium]|nr:phosphoribosyltransferase family protein [Victivallaceae bacterium]
MKFIPDAEGFNRCFAGMGFFGCPCCGSSDGEGGNHFCAECRESLEYIREEIRCPGCGGVLDGVLGLCSKCLAADARPYLGAGAVFEYRGKVRELVLSLKFNGRVELARAFAHEAAPLLKKVDFPVEIATAVPSHFLRRFFRGYNQAELFGRMLCKETQIPYRNLLGRTRMVAHQSSLPLVKRRQNARDSFVCLAPERVKGKSILLVDDVLTTGATLTDAAAALLRGGAASVWCFVIART